MVHIVLLAGAFLAALAAAPARGQAVTGATDGELLLRFKATFSNGDEVLSTWNGMDPCASVDSNGDSTWFGVGCLQGRVLMIQVGDKGLKGTIPLEGYLLPNSLTILNLYGNAISGSIPAAWRLPPKLLVVSLFSNQLTGSIPPSWVTELPNSLLVIYLNQNRLVGSIPPLWNAPNVSQLLLSENQLTGSIPWSTWNLTSILDLEINDNLLTGQLPPDLQLPDLIGTLHCQNNKLKGTDVNVAGNQLWGTLPGNMTFPSGMQKLDLSRNAFQGPLPSAWGASLPPALVQLNLANNLLNGTLPTWLARSNTTVAIAPGNQFCGEVPASPEYTSATGENVTSLPACGGSGVSSGSNTGAIVGGVVGGVVGLALFGLAGWCISTRGRQKKPPDVEQQSSPSAKDGGTKQSGPSLSNSDKRSPLMDDHLLAEIKSRLENANSTTNSLMTGSGTGSQGLASGTHTSDSKTCPSSNLSSRELGVDVDQYLIPLHDLQFIKQVGSGSFGRVYLCNWRETSVAAKLLLGPTAATASVSEAADLVLSRSSTVVANLRQEAQLLCALRHPNVLSFIGLTLAPPGLVSEYCTRGSLYTMLQEARDNEVLAEKLTWQKRLRMALGAALGMYYLHSFKPPVIHRDLKSPNLLVSSDWQAKVSDFNMSKIMGETSVDTSTNAVTNPTWLAPEVLQGESHTFASDIFSFGLVLWELMTWERPWANVANPWQVVTVVTAGGRPRIPDRDQLPGPGKDFEGLDAYVALIKRCWAQEPRDRPSFPVIISELRALLG